MGYTHYWDTNEDLTPEEWNEVTEKSNTIIQHCQNQGIQLVYDFDEGDQLPVIDGSHILFNGLEEEGHETFILTRSQTNFCFCKTARKEYDLAVTMILIAVYNAAPSKVSVRSDGDLSDWEEATQTYQNLFGDFQMPPEIGP